MSRAPSGVGQEAGASGEVPDAGSSAPDAAAPEEAGDERLRAAVAAWVAGDGGSADPSAVANTSGDDTGPGPTGDASPATALPQRKAAPKPGGGEPAAEPAAEADVADDAKSGAGSDDEGDAPSAGSEAKAAVTPAAKPDGENTGKADAEADAEPGAEADGNADTKAGAEDAGKPAAKAEGKSGAKTGGKPDAEADAESGAEGDAKPDGKADGKPAAGPADQAAAPADAQSDAKADGKSVAESDGKADAKSGSEADGKSAANVEGKPAAELAGQAAAPADAKPDAKADGKSVAEADGKADAKSGSEADGKSAAKAEGKPAAELAGQAAAPDDTKPDAKADGKSAAEADAKSGSEVGGKLAAEGDSKPAAEADGGPDAKADAKSGSEAGGKLAAKSDGKPAAKGDAKPDAKSDAQADGKSAAKSDAESDAKLGSKVDGKPDVQADGKSAAKDEAKPDAKPDAKADSKPAAEADAKSGSEAGGKPAAKAGDKADSAGNAKADGKSAANVEAKPAAKPDGKSAAKDDAKDDAQPDAKSDAKSDAKPAAKADGKAAGKADVPVDQATAVFKAVPQPVDQPTTTLKAAGTAQSSKFVPLRSLDAGKELPPEAEQPTVEPAERTTQQPLPPKPPLDLLAELTNTPPPPETRVRTAVRRVKVWTPLVILLVIVFGVIQAVRPLPTPSLSLTADATYSFDGDKASLPWPDEGQGWMDVQGIGTMDNFGKQTPVPIGSVAKSMTAYIVLKDHPLKAGADGPSIDIDATAEKEGGYDADGQNESTLNTVKEGDKISQKDALAAVMIPSANNIARLLARWDAGSEEAFVKKMNATAKKLGMKNTTYTDPSGLKESTVSTAEDQVKLGNELVQIPALTDITKLPTWTDPSGKKWTNYNRLVPYDGAIGIKTGTTTKAGGNLLFAATKETGGETVTVVGAILGQHRAPIIDTVNAVSKTAMLAAQDAVTSSTVLKKGDVVGYVDDQLGGHTPVTVTKDVKAVGWAGKTVRLQLADQDGKSVPHTGKAGETVGVLEVGDGEGGAVEVPVAIQKDLTEPGLGAKLTRVG
ncbi:D-alanyl-D-alanine carboxypeptidase [Streptomyces sp. NPDC059897]|uniref:D-alanyl-D-alanine carboxypeptidase n=1 Tax=Streptomyces sp. NPDC059897 TaxID=3346994 RepID=UPI00364DD9AD